MRKLFGTDGVRGVANTELTPELTFALGKAGAYVLSKKNEHAAKIIVGTDTRISATMLESALTAGMCSTGAVVYSAGVIPTPGIAYLVKKYNFDAGVMISASHNPMKDNGIKFFNNEGYKLPDSMEEEIEKIIENNFENIPRPVAEDVGYRIVCDTALEDYSNFLKTTLETENLAGLKIALDCANGATYNIASKIFENLDADVKTINSKPNGKNINLNCGSTHMESLAKFVVENSMDIGVAFDGDGDRCLLVDEKGNLVDGDQIMSICGTYLKANSRLNKDTIVATVMSNLGFFLMGEEQGLNIEKADVGDRYVLEKIREFGYNFGGEQSGHIIFSDHNTTGDGILTALKVSSILLKNSIKLSEAVKIMKVMPQVLKNAKVPNNKKYSYFENSEIKNAIEELEKKFNGKGRVLIRPSGTEPLVRVMIEGEDLNSLEVEAEKIVTLIETLL